MRKRTGNTRFSVCPACAFANPSDFRFCGKCGAALEQTAGEPRAGYAAPLPERRQLTVLFSDLIGSTRLSRELDVEDYRGLIVPYQTACTAAIERFGGTVARYFGDGILALFCHPLAHEDDPERAVRAGLAITAAMQTLPTPGGRAEPLGARIGIATGIVVVGDVIGKGAAEETAVLGETPNLAARLQGLASANSVVIAASTRALLGERFELADLGEHALHGIDEPVRAWRVMAPRFAGTRFEAAQQARTASLVNREDEMTWLRGLWQEAAASHGRVALIAGEAGIGKSRVVEALREEVAALPEDALRYQCSPHYVNTALHPLIEHIERAAAIAAADAPRQKLDKVAAWLGEAAGSEDAVPLIGALISIPLDERYPLPAVSPQRRKQRTLEIILDVMARKAAAQPLLVVLEDVHWVDPTTLELLALLVERAADSRILLVLTYRPEFVPPWRGYRHVESRLFKGLTSEHAGALAVQIAGDELPETVIGQVVAKTDGVPLFIEELTRAVLGAGYAPGQLKRDTLASAAGFTAIPSTLQDSLMARLDQLGSAKPIAQVAGAIGREFSYELLEAVELFPPEELREGLLALERAGLVYADSRGAAPQYMFKHALVQEAAYGSLLRSRRRELHQRIAGTLESRFPQTARDVPELVSHHWTEAGATERAIEWWLAAGRRAAERSEHREAVGHLRRGLALVAQLEASVRSARELELLLALGPALITTEGGGTADVSTLYTRALELCTHTPQSAAHFVAHWGWWRVSMNHRMGRERANKLLGLARNLGDPALLVQAHHSQWATLYMLGAHRECCLHIDAGLGLYDQHHQSVHAGLYGGHDARVCGLGERALACWLLGRPQEALGHAQDALAWADRLRHAGSRAHALDYSVVLAKFRRDVDAVYRRAGELITYAAEQKLKVHRAKGAIFRGWARALIEDAQAGLGEMLDAIASEESTDTPGDFTVYYEMLAEAFGRAGRYEEGLKAVDEAFVQAARCGIVFWNAELYRRRGELLLGAGGQRAAALAAFEEALACARAQEARSLELRAALSLARMRGDDPAAARAILRLVYARFEEGLDTPDLIEAGELLEGLS